MKMILEIQEGDKVHLPKNLHETHNTCAIVYDLISEFIINDNYEFLKNTNFKFEEHHIKIDELKNNSITGLEWLKENNLTDQIEIVLTKKILIGVLGDLLNFVFESLHCAKRGKMTVAYSLIRKPISDSLLILEELLTDRKNFIKNFHFDGDINKYDPSRRNLDKFKIIESAINKLGFKALFDANYIHELRYDKKSPIGLNSMSNQAIHIVTKDKNYQTEKGELNFVFSSKENQEYYYNHYYTLVTYLLIYSSSIIDELTFSLTDNIDHHNIFIIKEFKRLIALLLFGENQNQSKLPNENSSLVFNEISSNVIIECEHCKTKNIISKPDCILLFKSNLLLCSNCFVDLKKTSINSVIEKINLLRAKK